MPESTLTPGETKTIHVSPAGLVIVAIALLVAVAAWWGYREGAARSPVHWHTGTAYSTDSQISTEVDGWTYSIPLAVPWEDNAGTGHDGDRPACLPPSATELHVRFAEIAVNVEGTGFRQVVFVSCKN